MNNQLKLINLLKKGIVEIRVLSASSGGGDLKRINRLANILHNAPDYILETEKFDFDILRVELENYLKDYPNNSFNYLVIFADSN